MFCSPFEFVLDAIGTVFATFTAESAPFSTFYLFAVAMAAGIPPFLPLVPVAAIGRRFFILLSLIAVVFVALAIGAVGIGISYAYLGLGAFLIVYNTVLPRQRGVDWSERREAIEGTPHGGWNIVSHVCLVGAIVCGLAGLAGDAAEWTDGADATTHLAMIATFISSSLLLGGSLVAMVLGHWYLVAHKLSFTPLARITAALLGILLLRALVTATGVGLQSERWDETIARSGWVGVLLEPGMFVLTRAIFGLVAPTGLLWMAWRCVKIRSNQSATGILYVTVAFVLIGEIIAKYLLVSQRWLL